jgi:hypothetical protein
LILQPWCQVVKLERFSRTSLAISGGHRNPFEDFDIFPGATIERISVPYPEKPELNAVICRIT